MDYNEIKLLKYSIDRNSMFSINNVEDFYLFSYGVVCQMCW